MLIKVFSIWVESDEIVSIRPEPYAEGNSNIYFKNGFSCTLENLSVDEIVAEINNQLKKEN